MKKNLLLLIPCLLCLGFSIETPETLEQERLKRENWNKQLEAAYDFEALREFLVVIIEANPDVEGVRLGNAEIERAWESDVYGRTCGDWYFWADFLDIDRFHISWVYASHETEEQSTIQETIRFYCERVSAKEFRLIRVVKVVDEIIELNV